MSRCVACNTNLACTKGVPKSHDLCRPCWVSKGRPWDHPEQVCETCGERWIAGTAQAQEQRQCKKCLRKDVDVQDKDRGCRRNGCGMPLRKTKYCVSNQLCKACFTEEEQTTWQTVCPRLSKEYAWTDKTLFLGNLHYKCQKRELEDFVRQQLERPPELPDNFEVKLVRGGLQGDHNSAKKIFKRFAFIIFDIVTVAYRLLQKCDGEEFQGRKVKAHPAVNTGSWMWYANVWWESKDWKVIDVEKFYGLLYCDENGYYQWYNPAVGRRLQEESRQVCPYRWWIGERVQ